MILQATDANNDFEKHYFFPCSSKIDTLLEEVTLICEWKR